MEQSGSKSAVQFGAGNIGRGLMGQLLWDSGFETIFVDVSGPLVDRLNARGSYPLRLLDAHSQQARELTIDRFRALDTRQEAAIAEAIAAAPVAATAVGVANLEAIAPLLAAGIRRRREQDTGPLDIYLCENLLGAAGMLAAHVMKLLEEPARKWVGKNIGFVATSVARIVGGAGARRPDDALLIIADAHRDIPYDGPAVRAGGLGIEGFHPVHNFQAEVERKIFTHNLAHAALAYLGYLRGHAYIHETFDDDFVRSAFDGALNETTEALLRRYPADLDRREHLAVRRDVRVRFGNPLLRDPIARVAKDPLRKLGPDDRIIGAATLCRSQAIVPHHIATVCAAALCYDCPDDPKAVHLQKMIEEMGPENTLHRVSGVEPAGDFGRSVLAWYQDLRRVKAT
jgi:mannitol-1-phosphate 5-dehydrogenase